MTQDRLEIIDMIHKDNKYDDISHDKYLILHELYKDADLIEVLNNKELESKKAMPEEYRNINIFSFLKIPDIQSEVKNFICFEVDDIQESTVNNAFIKKMVRFRTVSHERDVKTDFGIDRQDLLALIIKDIFNWSNVLGLQLKKIYDSGKVADNGYYYREINFLTDTPNGLQRGTTSNLMKR